MTTRLRVEGYNCILARPPPKRKKFFCHNGLRRIVCETGLRKLLPGTLLQQDLILITP